MVIMDIVIKIYEIIEYVEIRFLLIYKDFKYRFFKYIRKGEGSMKRNNSFAIIVGVVFGLFIIPGVFNWLGYPTPSDRIANMFTALLGPPTFINGVIAFSIAGVLIISLIFGLNKFSKRIENASR
jgi:cytochrome bd-type quinol oxidase subunit 1